MHTRSQFYLWYKMLLRQECHPYFTMTSIKEGIGEDVIQRSSEVKEKSFSRMDVEKDLQTLLWQFLSTLSNNCCYYHTAQRLLHVRLSGDLVHTIKWLGFGSHSRWDWYHTSSDSSYLTENMWKLTFEGDFQGWELRNSTKQIQVKKTEKTEKIIK